MAFLHQSSVGKNAPRTGGNGANNSAGTLKQNMNPLQLKERLTTSGGTLDFHGTLATLYYVKYIIAVTTS